MDASATQTGLGAPEGAEPHSGLGATPAIPSAGTLHDSLLALLWPTQLSSDVRQRRKECSDLADYIIELVMDDRGEKDALVRAYRMGTEARARTIAAWLRTLVDWSVPLERAAEMIEAGVPWSDSEQEQE